MRKSLERYNKFLIIVFHVTALSFTYYSSYLLRFDFAVPHHERNIYFATLLLVLLIKLPVFYIFGLFRGWWQYSGMSDLLDIAKATFLSFPLITLVIYGFTHFSGFPRLVLVLDAILTMFVIGGSRFAVRTYTEYVQGHPTGTNTLIIGAGDAGSLIARELKLHSNGQYNPIGFVDDNRSKKGIKFQGLRVLGTTDDLPELISRYEIVQLLIAMPSATGAQIQRIISKCRECRAAFRTLPALSDVINGTVSLQQIREVKVDDLLGRAPIKLDRLKIQSKLKDKVVMVTGAGRSIGSELARQVARFAPKKLILFERSESDLHRMELELEGYGMPLDFVPVVGDILDVTRLKQVNLNVKC